MKQYEIEPPSLELDEKLSKHRIGFGGGRKMTLWPRASAYLSRGRRQLQMTMT